MVDVYEIVITHQAREHIADIFRYLQENVSEDTAWHVGEGIASEIEKLEKFPTGLPIVHEISNEDEVYRFALKWKYKIIFFVNEEDRTVEVIAVTHSSQHPDRLKDLI